MTTTEKLFVQIFDRKKRITEQVKQRTDLYRQHLASKILLDGYNPPLWLWNPNFKSESSDPQGALSNSLCYIHTFRPQISTSQEFTLHRTPDALVCGVVVERCGCRLWLSSGQLLVLLVNAFRARLDADEITEKNKSKNFESQSLYSEMEFQKKKKKNLCSEFHEQTQAPDIVSFSSKLLFLNRCYITSS